MFRRATAQPNSQTLSIPPIRELASKYLSSPSFDPFARNCRLADLRNDLDESTASEFHMHATDFLESLEPQSYQFAIFDPPYSPRQTHEVYKSVGLTCSKEDTQCGQWSRWGEAIGFALSVGGICFKCGWNSCRPFEGCKLLECLLVCHGSMHHDTVVTVWEKTLHQARLFGRPGLKDLRG